MEESIVLKKGLAGARFVFMSILAFIISSCAGNTVSNDLPSLEEEFEHFLAEKENIPIEALHTTPEGDSLYKVPNYLIDDCYLTGKRDYCLVLRKLTMGGKTYLQFVKAEIVASNGSYQTVKRLNPGDAFLASPQTLLPQLSARYKVAARKRFMHVQRY